MSKCFVNNELWEMVELPRYKINYGGTLRLSMKVLKEKTMSCKKSLNNDQKLSSILRKLFFSLTCYCVLFTTQQLFYKFTNTMILPYILHWNFLTVLSVYFVTKLFLMLSLQLRSRTWYFLIGMSWVFNYKNYMVYISISLCP